MRLLGSAPEAARLLQERGVDAQVLIDKALGENAKFAPALYVRGRSLELGGNVDAAVLVAHAQSSNSMWGWILRAVGFVLLWIAFSMMLGPLSSLAAVLPPLGRLVGRAGLSVRRRQLRAGG